MEVETTEEIERALSPRSYTRVSQLLQGVNLSPSDYGEWDSGEIFQRVWYNFVNICCMNGSQEPDRAGTFLMNWMWRKPADTLGERARRRIVVHLIPWLFFLYILAFLDRANISVAKFGMEKPPIDGGLGFNNEIIGLGFGMFFWGYWFLEVPSTISVVRWGARWVFVRILILWGICTVFIGSIGTSFATKMFSWLPHFPEHTAAIDGIDQRIEAWFGWVARLGDHPDPLNAVSDFMNFLNGLPESPINQFYFFRFMLGFFEGGFFPSVIVYLGLWFRTEDRAKAIATFMAAIPLSNVIGNPFSGLILKVNWLDIPGWRWIFVIQGIAPVFAGIATLFFLPSRPNKATWLPPEERDWLMGELDREQKEKKGHGHWEWVRHLGIVLLLTGVYFCQNVSSYGLLTFMPSIFKAQFDPNYNGADFWASVLSSLVYMMALLGMLFNGLHSDRTKERIFHVAVPYFLVSLGIWIAAWLDTTPILPAMVLIFWIGPSLYAHLPAFWPIPTMFLGATAAASAIGFINMIGNFGGFFGPKWFGAASTGQIGFATALRILAPFPLCAGAIILLVGFVRRKSLAKG